MSLASVCLASGYWASLDRVVFAATTLDVAACGLPDLTVYEELRLHAADRTLTEVAGEDDLREGAVAVLQDWTRPHALGLAHPSIYAMATSAPSLANATATEHPMPEAVPSPRRTARFDWTGQASTVLALGALAYALIEGALAYALIEGGSVGFGASRIVAGFLIAAASFAVLLFAENRAMRRCAAGALHTEAS